MKKTVEVKCWECPNYEGCRVAPSDLFTCPTKEVEVEEPAPQLTPEEIVYYVMADQENKGFSFEDCQKILAGAKELAKTKKAFDWNV